MQVGCVVIKGAAVITRAYSRHEAPAQHSTSPAIEKTNDFLSIISVDSAHVLNPTGSGCEFTVIRTGESRGRNLHNL